MKIFSLLILFATSVSAAEVNPWLGLSVQKNIEPKLSLLWENQYRLFDGEYSELQWRVGVIYRPNKNWSFAGGGFASFNKDYELQEFRPWQQAIYAHSIDKFTILARYRQEQRFFTKADEFAHRSRIQLRANYALSETFTPYASTEFFFGLNQAVKANFPDGYNQNRTQVGTLIKVSDTTNLETSLLKVHNKGVNRNTDNTVWWTSIQFRFN